MKCPLLWMAGWFVLGIAIASRFFESPMGDATSSAGMALALASCCEAVGLVLLRSRQYRTSLATAMLGFIFAGSAAFRLFDVRFPPNHVSHLAGWEVELRDPLRLEGVVVSTPARTSYGLQFDLALTALESLGRRRQAIGKVRLRVEGFEDPDFLGEGRPVELHYGDTVRALARLHRPRSYRNPGGFDFAGWMANVEDIEWVGTVKSPVLIEKIAGPRSRRVSAAFEAARQKLLGAIDRMFPPWSASSRAGAVLKAVLLGDRSALDSETVETFRKTGLYHLLVIAGLHVGLLAFLAAFVLRRAPVAEEWRTLVVLGFLMAYAFLVEQRAPTLRATLMVAAFLVGRLLYRGRVALNAVGLASIVLLVARPSWLFETGFQLSFAVALLIVGLAVPILERTTEPYRKALSRMDDTRADIDFEPRLAQFRLDVRSIIEAASRNLKPLANRPRLARALVISPIRLLVWSTNAVLFSAVLQIGLILPMVQTFHRVSFAGAGLNALAVPVMTLLLAVAVPGVLLSALWSGAAGWMAKLLSPVINLLFALADLPRLPAWLSYRAPEPPMWVACGFVLALLLSALMLGRKPKVFWVALGAFGVFSALVALHPFAASLPRGQLEVTAIDCGSGESIFIVLPGGRTLLVDGGGTPARSTQQGAFQGRSWEPGEDIVSPYLWSRGIETLDVIALSHAHEDHMGGLAAVLRNFRVREFWHGANPSSPPYVALLKEAASHGVRLRQLAAGARFDFGGAQVDVLWPPEAEARLGSIPPPVNDLSMVMRVSQGPACVLLTGDISARVESELVAAQALAPCSVLKVAHHGSGGSSTTGFIARTSPRVALIAGGLLDASGRGDRETLERLQHAGVEIFSTEKDGAVKVEMRAGQLDVYAGRALAARWTSSTGAARAGAGGSSKVR